MLYTLRFFLKCSFFFHNANLFGSCIIHILYPGCAKIKKNNNSGAKGLKLPDPVVAGNSRRIVTDFVVHLLGYTVKQYEFILS